MPSLNTWILLPKLLQGWPGTYRPYFELEPGNMSVGSLLNALPLLGTGDAPVETTVVLDNYLDLAEGRLDGNVLCSELLCGNGVYLEDPKDPGTLTFGSYATPEDTSKFYTELGRDFEWLRHRGPLLFSKAPRPQPRPEYPKMLPVRCCPWNF